MQLGGEGPTDDLPSRRASTRSVSDPAFMSAQTAHRDGTQPAATPASVPGAAGLTTTGPS